MLMRDRRGLAVSQPRCTGCPSPTAPSEKFHGLAQILGQLQAPNRHFRSNFWANLQVWHKLGQPCELSDLLRQVEKRMIRLLLALMAEVDAPPEQYERLGLPLPADADDAAVAACTVVDTPAGEKMRAENGRGGVVDIKQRSLWIEGLNSYKAAKELERKQSKQSKL